MLNLLIDTIHVVSQRQFIVDKKIMAVENNMIQYVLLVMNIFNQRNEQLTWTRELWSFVKRQPHNREHIETQIDKYYENWVFKVHASSPMRSLKSLNMVISNTS